MDMTKKLEDKIGVKLDDTCHNGVFERFGKIRHQPRTLIQYIFSFSISYPPGNV